jgi:hypothetical protein
VALDVGSGSERWEFKIEAPWLFLVGRLAAAFRRHGEKCGAARGGSQWRMGVIDGAEHRPELLDGAGAGQGGGSGVLTRGEIDEKKERVRDGRCRGEPVGWVNKDTALVGSV